jgi:dipeptidyl aminopeptidase/acylaminoacyl peptidase
MATTQPANTPSLTLTQVLLPIKTVNQKCLPVESVLLPSFLAEGIVFLANDTFSPAYGTLITLSSGDSPPLFLSNLPPLDFGNTSPNGEWLAYHHPPDDQLGSTLVIVSADGQINSTVPWSNDWQNRYPQWLDNERLIFKNPQFGSVAFSIINPFTFQRQERTLDLPDLFSEDPDPSSQDIAWGAVPDSTLTRAAYLRRRVDPVTDWYNLVLWDLETGKELWVLNKGTTKFTEPVWSSDGTQLAAVALNQMEDNYDRLELYIVSRDGKVQQWIDIKGYYPNINYGKLSWSPNGRYIAFTMKEGDRPLLILDTLQKVVLDYCIPGGASQSNVIWSPDSTQLILPRQSEPFIVIDLERGAAAQIVQDANFRPVGWLVNPPANAVTATSIPAP